MVCGRSLFPGCVEFGPLSHVSGDLPLGGGGAGACSSSGGLQFCAISLRKSSIRSSRFAMKFSSGSGDWDNLFVLMGCTHAPRSLGRKF